VPTPDLSASDLRATVAAQVGRPMRSAVAAVAACDLGLPIAVAVPPFLDDGTPFPTGFWLSCPLAVRRIGRLESMGAVKQLQKYGEANPAFASAIEERHRQVAVDRAEEVGEVDGPTPSGGVGGTATGIKCLHAHYADHLGSNANPVGEVTAPFVEPLNCEIPCVVRSGDVWERNSRWSEPK
jgi:hypothetical protein